jgi:hypothetical protein
LIALLPAPPTPITMILAALSDSFIIISNILYPPEDLLSFHWKQAASTGKGAPENIL